MAQDQVMVEKMYKMLGHILIGACKFFAFVVKSLFKVLYYLVSSIFTKLSERSANKNNDIENDHQQRY
ncbi:hypothetical protein MUB42_02345 [Apilactobacillus kunkeei]|nr:hypothetical protein MUB42_02345 [Apilactobacillus kunkeei]